MLRTRRRDNNVKPNRRDSSRKSRLDRKSSRGMLYENEELRLKTININAEIERGQSDIKKLKRENEMLKKEIWCLRDEYDKLDRLLKDKKIDFSSSSTTYSSSSESESCSSCTEEPEESETSQNIKNVQKTTSNLRNIHDLFDHLSVVTEETSCENSERNSLSRNENDNMLWNYQDKEAIKPDQSYPIYQGIIKAQTLPNQMGDSTNYFAPIQHSKSFDDNRFNQPPLYPEDLYAPTPNDNNKGSLTPPIAISPSPPPLYENQQVVFPLENNNEAENFLSKKIVHTEASSFFQNVILGAKNVNSSTTAEVKSLEKKGLDVIVKIDNQNFGRNLTYSNTTPSNTTTFSNGGNLDELLQDIESISQDILKLTDLQRAHQNVFPPPQPPPNDPPQKALSKSDERLHKSELNVVLMPKAMPLIGFDKYKNIQRSFESINSKPLMESVSEQNLSILPQTRESSLPPPPKEEHNPFFFGNLTDNYVNADYFSRRYNPDNFPPPPPPQLDSQQDVVEAQKEVEKAMDNEENIKLKTTKLDDEAKDETKKRVKSPKLSITRKVSIHFKGKKEKERLKKLSSSSSKSVFDFSNKSLEPKPPSSPSKIKQVHQKTPSIESKKSTTETSNFEPKTPNSSESEKKNLKKTTRKSVSISPERGKHVHVLHDGQMGKKHKKHRRERSGATRTVATAGNHRSSMDPRVRERSYSICTDRSLIGPNSGFGYYDEYSDRERTNSGSSCESHDNHRKMSGISNVPLNGKLPWCGCWGNGCL